MVGTEIEGLLRGWPGPGQLSQSERTALLPEPVTACPVVPSHPQATELLALFFFLSVEIYHT